jgi:hypothetical protein
MRFEAIGSILSNSRRSEVEYFLKTTSLHPPPCGRSLLELAEMLKPGSLAIFFKCAKPAKRRQPSFGKCHFRKGDRWSQMPWTPHLDAKSSGSCTALVQRDRLRKGVVFCGVYSIGLRRMYPATSNFSSASCHQRLGASLLLGVSFSFLSDKRLRFDV